MACYRANPSCAAGLRVTKELIFHSEYLFINRGEICLPSNARTNHIHMILIIETNYSAQHRGETEW